MFGVLRRLWAHRFVPKFLMGYLPEIGLGNVEEFKCNDFRLGCYSVKTTTGEYSISFCELENSIKCFHLDLCECKGENFERITFSITGNIRFKIVPYEFIISREGKGQGTDLYSGESTIYDFGKHDCDKNYIMYKNPIMMSQIVDISKVIGITMYYI